MRSNHFLLSVSLAILSLTVGSQAGYAQITADVPANAPDTSGAQPTVVTPAGNVFNITGGTTTGTNLFHSFGQFNVGAGQTANFVTPPTIANVLARVSGGNASYINGVVQLSGNTSANLYLMNPAGVLFGPNATLNVPASFTATTATAIGFGTGLTADSYFNAVDGRPGGFSFGNNYANLTDAPVSFLFQPGATGAVVNQGANLRPGGTGTLALLGNSVLNAADINAPGGSVVAASVPTPQAVRLAVPGNLLSLEFPTSRFEAPNGFNETTQDNTFVAFSPTALPALITGGTVAPNAIAAGAGGVTVNGNVVNVTGNAGAGGATGAASTFNAGDLFTRNITVAGAAGGSAGPNAGNVILISRGNTIAGNINNGIAQGATISQFGSTANGGTIGGGTVRLVSGFSGVDTAGRVVTARANSIQVGNIDGGQIILESGTGITGGEFTTRGITTGRNDAITLTANGSGQPGNISVINLFANSNADAAGAGGNINVNVPVGIFRSTGTISSANLGTAAGGVNQTLSSGATGGAGSAISVAATGNINISQAGATGTNFVQGANLERDANNIIVYRLASNENIRVLITGVNSDGSFQLINAETGAAIAGSNRVIVRQLNNASTINTASGGGAQGLIIRLNRVNTFLNAIAGDTRVGNAQTIVLRSTNGSVQTGSAGAALPGAAPNSTAGPAPGGTGGTGGGNVGNGGAAGGGLINRPANNLLVRDVENARDQLEQDNAKGISSAEIAAASPVIGAAESTAAADEGVLTRKISREVPIPVEVPVVVEEKKEEKPKENKTPKKRVLPQLW